MENKPLLQNKPGMINWQITLKVAAIGIIALILLIPKVMILELIGEREKTADSSKKEIMQKWSEAQTIRGPILVVPFYGRNQDQETEEAEIIQKCFILPENLQIEGQISPEKLYRSIYETVVYDATINLSGDFNISIPEELEIHPEKILWEKAELQIAISDLRGIKDQVTLEWKGEKLTFIPGLDNSLLGAHGISIPIHLSGFDENTADFRCSLHLKGSELLKFAPLGKTTTVNLSSPWNDPGFEGNFLPAERNISSEGFQANWKVLHFNRNFPQTWIGSEYSMNNEDFGVKLVTTANHYQKSMRTAKYGILIILFTFLSFFLNEMITKQRVHPFQYILVGFAVLVFYLLLLSISEQLGFNTAYLIAAVAVILMVFLYSKSFLKKWNYAIIQALLLTFSFGFIFILMQLESYALLAGSIGLFAILGLTMFFTRNISWYND